MINRFSKKREGGKALKPPTVNSSTKELGGFGQSLLGPRRASWGIKRETSAKPPSSFHTPSPLSQDECQPKFMLEMRGARRMACLTLF